VVFCVPPAVLSSHEPAVSLSDTLIVENETQKGAPSDENASAKMGKEEGTHTGPTQGAPPENDTKKVDQPPRKDVPSNENPQQ
jgi:hypothetical protein